MKKEVVIIVAVVAILFGSTYAVYSLSGGNSGVSTNAKQVKGTSIVVPKKDDFIYFYGATCPHCKNVNEYLNKKGITPEKLGYKKLEVYYNKENAALMEGAAQVANIPEGQVGVPFVYYKGTAYIGTPEVIGLFDKLNK